jgi:hypothetical protein
VGGLVKLHQDGQGRRVAVPELHLAHIASNITNIYIWNLCDGFALREDDVHDGEAGGSARVRVLKLDRDTVRLGGAQCCTWIGMGPLRENGRDTLVFDMPAGLAVSFVSIKPIKALVTFLNVVVFSDP